jgi:glycosyltransferase involved in cell wall biosynthesis
MSSFLQNTKRGFYFRFADEISAVSKQFMLEINNLRRISIKYRIVFPSKVVFDRVGIYLPRTDFLQSIASESFNFEDRPFVFLGRMIKWKGFAKFIHIADNLFPERFAVVFTSSDGHPDTFNANFFENKYRRELVLSRSIASIRWPNLAIHIYPSMYTSDTKFPMSISFNVLESLILGIPSLISAENFESWPELKGSILCFETDWSDDDVKMKVRRATELTTEMLLNEAQQLRRIISIESHCLRLIKFTRR